MSLIGTCTNDNALINSYIDSKCLLGSYCYTVPCTFSGGSGLRVIFQELCPKKYYCETPTTIQLCPKYHYCANGTVTPHECTFSSISCSKEGMKIPNTPYLVLAVLAIGSAIFGLLVFLPYLVYIIDYYLMNAEKKLQALSPLFSIKYDSHTQEQYAVLYALTTEYKFMLQEEDDKVISTSSQNQRPLSEKRSPHSSQNNSPRSPRTKALTLTPKVQYKASSRSFHTLLDTPKNNITNNKPFTSVTLSTDPTTTTTTTSMSPTNSNASSSTSWDSLKNRALNKRFVLSRMESFRQEGLGLESARSKISEESLNISESSSTDPNMRNTDLMVTSPSNYHISHQISTIVERGSEDSYDTNINKQLTIHSHKNNVQDTNSQYPKRTTDDLVEINDFHYDAILDPLSITFDKLSLHLRNRSKQTILHAVSGEMKAMHITGIMGPSGSGKTSLLSLLRGQAYYATTGGKMYVNQKQVMDLGIFRDKVAYVPQDDIMYDDLTVEENLKFTAVLFNKRGYTTVNEVMPMVTHTLQLLSILHIRHSVVGSPEKKGISGGQKKRVSIGMEMLKEASLFLLDEPTSGLDSASSISLMNTLHNFTELGVTVVATLHQPRYEILQLIDEILLLAPGGRVVYYGPTTHLESHFRTNLGYTLKPHCNMGDFMMDILAGFVRKDSSNTFMEVQDITKEICDKWEALNEGKTSSFKMLTYDLTEQDTQHATNMYMKIYTIVITIIKTFMKIMYITCFRQICLFYRTLRTFIIDCAFLYVMGFIMSFLFSKYVINNLSNANISEQISCMQLSFCLTVSSTGLRLFSTDSLMRSRETEAGLSIIPYYLGKYIGNSIEVISFPAIYLLSYYTFSTPLSTYREFYTMLLLLQLVIYSLANFGSAVFPQKNRNVVLGGTIVIFWAFGGLTTSIDELRKNMSIFGVIINFLSPFRYSYKWNTYMEYRHYPPIFYKIIQRFLTKYVYGDFMSYNDFQHQVNGLIHENIVSLIVYPIIVNMITVCYLIYAKDDFKIYRTFLLYFQSIYHQIVPLYSTILHKSGVRSESQHSEHSSSFPSSRSHDPSHMIENDIFTTDNNIQDSISTDHAHTHSKDSAINTQDVQVVDRSNINQPSIINNTNNSFRKNVNNLAIDISLIEEGRELNYKLIT